MTVTKNFISDAVGVLDLPGDINSLFVLITMLTSHAYKKKFATIFLLFLEVCPSVIYFFSEKFINKNF